MNLSELKHFYRENNPKSVCASPQDSRLAAEIQEQQSLLKTYEVMVKKFQSEIQNKDSEINQLLSKQSQDFYVRKQPVKPMATRDVSRIKSLNKRAISKDVNSSMGSRAISEAVNSSMELNISNRYGTLEMQNVATASYADWYLPSTYVLGVQGREGFRCLNYRQKRPEELAVAGYWFLRVLRRTRRIVDWLAQNFKRDEGIDHLKDKQALQRLTETAKKAKMELSSLTQTSISLPFITATVDGPKHIDSTLTRVKFEELCSDLLDRLRGPIETALKDANLSFKDLDEVILVGGSTRIPAVQELLRKMTRKEPNVTVNPDEVVALGAAVQAGVLAGEVSDIVLLDVTPLSLGLKILCGVMTKIIPKNTTLPTSKLEVFPTAADGQTSVEINVREFSRDNISLGSFRLDGISHVPLGVPQILVKFGIDAEGIGMK
uniref:DUF641 domain-containing protein n=1 Tax=Quercus lobata TaxID=97700 RepID=A0A7N2LC82_QUELO